MVRKGMLIGFACVAAAMLWLFRQAANPRAQPVPVQPGTASVDVHPEVERILHTIETDAPWILAVNAKSSTKS